MFYFLKKKRKNQLFNYTNYNIPSYYITVILTIMNYLLFLVITILDFERNEKYIGLTLTIMCYWVIQ